MTLLTTVMALDFFAQIPAGLYALIGTIVGTVGLRVLEKWLNRNKESQDLRRDLHQEIKDLQTRLDLVEDEVTHFRTLYYAEQEKVALLRIMVIQLGGELPEVLAKQVEKDHNEARKE